LGEDSYWLIISEEMVGHEALSENYQKVHTKWAYIVSEWRPLRASGGLTYIVLTFCNLISARVVIGKRNRKMRDAYILVILCLCLCLSHSFFLHTHTHTYTIHHISYLYCNILTLTSCVYYSTNRKIQNAIVTLQGHAFIHGIRFCSKRDYTEAK